VKTRGADLECQYLSFHLFIHLKSLYFCTSSTLLHLLLCLGLEVAYPQGDKRQ